MQPAPGAWSPEGLTLLAFPNVALVALVAQYLLGDLLDELEHLLRHRVLELLAPVFRNDPLVGQAHHYQLRQLTTANIKSLV
ncbi:hypothetical protein D3C78_1441490 [compost metagenome]